MNDTTMSMDISGVDELVKELASLSKQYPDAAGDLLRKEARGLRKEVVKNVKSDTKFDSSSKRSLAKIGSYRVSQVKGAYEHQYVEISAKSPHFHLVEHGHNIIMPRWHGVKGEKGVKIPNENADANVGFVQGKHMMANAIKTYEHDMPTHVGEMVDELLKEGGLI